MSALLRNACPLSAEYEVADLKNVLIKTLRFHNIIAMANRIKGISFICNEKLNTKAVKKAKKSNSVRCFMLFTRKRFIANYGFYGTYSSGLCSVLCSHIFKIQLILTLHLQYHNLEYITKKVNQL